ncbi:MAG: hypothetical protein E7166_00720 [Firmicutes bacterium]|nr:hypothetical protein [Bacillota bacterium]
MKKYKYLIIISVLVCAIITCLFVMVFNNDKKVLKKPNKQVEKIIKKDNAQDENQDITLPSAEEVESNKTDDTINNNLSNEPNNIQDSNYNEPVIKEESIIEKPPNNTSTQNVTVEKPIESNNTDIPQEEQPIENDAEYQELLSIIDSYDHMDCLEKAGDIHSASRENIINIRNTSCEDVIYKGQVIGYRIILFYNDGSWKYYNATN